MRNKLNRLSLLRHLNFMNKSRDLPSKTGSGETQVKSKEMRFCRNGTIGFRDNMTVYRAPAQTGGGCNDWSVLHRVNSGPAGYSCLASMAGRRLGILYEHAWSKEAVAVNDRDRTNIVFELLRADY